ncbi:MAG: YhbY family RNA-binding protein [Myxococcota bacterium]
MSDAKLLGFQRTYLRGKAHDLEPVVQVGDAGISAAVIKAVEQALLDHELIKVRMRQPDDKKAMAQELADTKSDAQLQCGLVGHTVILYRRHPKPRLHLPVTKVISVLVKMFSRQLS